jgi:recombinational DNA repair protein (RecF pathway)
MPACERCGKEVEVADIYIHGSRSLCEACYMEVLNPPKACDPWAVYSAKRSSMKAESLLTPLQERILDLLTSEGPLTPKVLQERLGVTEAVLQRDFVTLRHMERVKASKEGGQICYILFKG